MNTYTHEIQLESTEKTDFIDVTKKVEETVQNSKIINGSVTVYTPHTTTSIRINENEPRLIVDLKNYMEKKAPSHINYLHDDIDKRPVPENEKINAHSHIKSLFMGTSETIPLVNKQIQMGQWQSVFFVDFDGPQNRKMIIHIIGK